MSFSTVIRLNDVDDYITPEQTCIRPVKIDTQAGRTKSVRIELDGSYTGVTEEGDTYSLKKASISLNDCLACSGCITTAESVLINEHSTEAFYAFLKSNREQESDRKLLSISVSPQSLSSIASRLINSNDSDSSSVALFFRTWLDRKGHTVKSESVLLDQIRAFVFTVLCAFGAHLVTDTTWLRDVSLYEACEEFKDRFRNGETVDDQLPVFCGICPGWICYAEKTGSQQIGTKKFSLIPYLSTVRSPQQLSGRLVKKQNASSVYHVTIMPCFDKKLEASRTEFTTEQGNNGAVTDVDLVLATNELWSVLERVSSDQSLVDGILTGTNPAPPQLNSYLTTYLTELDRLFENPPRGLSSTTTFNLPPMYRHPGSGSGGYAACVFRQSANDLFNIPLNKSDLAQEELVIVRQLQNRHFKEFLLFPTPNDRNVASERIRDSTSRRTPYRNGISAPQPLLAFAVATGFRNIQNVCQLLKSAKKSDRRSAPFPFDYVEVMACPGGCLNGGGQLKNSTDQTSSLYFDLPTRDFMSDSNARDILTSLSVDGLRTTYRTLPAIEIINPGALQW